MAGFVLILAERLHTAGAESGSTTESFLVVADADGKNPRTLLTGKAPTAPAISIGAVDWR